MTTGKVTYTPRGLSDYTVLVDGTPVGIVVKRRYAMQRVTFWQFNGEGGQRGRDSTRDGAVQRGLARAGAEA